MSKEVNPYIQSAELEQEIWANCSFIFDTSALLELYFFSANSQKKLFENVLNPLRGRLWIPNHVNFEYLKNRVNSIKKPISEKYSPVQKTEIEDLKKTIKNFESKFTDLMQKTKKQDIHPYLDQALFVPVSAQLAALSSSFEDFSKFVDECVAQRIKEIELLEKEDTVLNHIRDLFLVGPEYSFSRKMAILAESELRFRNKIPPGYKDAEGSGQKEGLQRIGDLINWYQIIEHAASSCKPVVFVTNDVKDDWCYTYRHSNEIRIDRPREELVQELAEKAGVKFWMYTFSQFLYQCKSILDTSIDADVLGEAKEAAQDRLSNLGEVPRTDGLYILVGESTHFLCFSESGEVSKTSTRKAFSLISDKAMQLIYTQLESSSAPRGKYFVDGDRISFTTNAINGKVHYEGFVNSDGNLVLDTRSEINGFTRNAALFEFHSSSEFF